MSGCLFGYESVIFRLYKGVGNFSSTKKITDQRSIDMLRNLQLLYSDPTLNVTTSRSPKMSQFYIQIAKSFHIARK